MFIAHGQRLRKYAPWILAGVLALLLPSFVVLFSPTANVKSERSELPTIAGKPVNQAEFQQAKNVVMAQVMINTGRQPTRSLQFEDELNIQAIQHLLLTRKAKEFGIRVTDDEVIQQLRGQPAFHNEQRQFDPDRYQRFTIRLNNLGISEAQFEEVLRQQIVLARLSALVGTAAKVTPTELKLNYMPLHEETTIDYVEFDIADRKEPVKINEDEAKVYYEQRKEVFRKPAEVKVRYVYFTLADAHKSITVSEDEIAEYYERNKHNYVDAEKKPKLLADVKDEVQKDLIDLRAQRLAGDRATGLSVKLVYEPGDARPGFAKIAADSGVTPEETGFFSLDDSIPGIDAGRQFNQTAFALNPDMPFSDPVRGEDGYYVLEYLASHPSEIPPFDEIKQQVIDQLKQQRAYEATVNQGRELAGKVKLAVAGGKRFADACATLGLKAKSSQPFTAMDEEPVLPAAKTVQEVALGMATNTVSDFIPTANGGLFFHLNERRPPSPEAFEKDRPQLEAQMLERDRQAIFNDWVNALMRQERVEYQRKARPQQPEMPVDQSLPPQS